MGTQYSSTAIQWLQHDRVEMIFNFASLFLDESSLSIGRVIGSSLFGATKEYSKTCWYEQVYEFKKKILLMKRKDTLSGIYAFLHMRKTDKHLNTHSSWVSNREFFSGIKLIEDIEVPSLVDGKRRNLARVSDFVSWDEACRVPTHKITHECKIPPLSIHEWWNLFLPRKKGEIYTFYREVS